MREKTQPAAQLWGLNQHYGDDKLWPGGRPPGLRIGTWATRPRRSPSRRPHLCNRLPRQSLTLFS